MATSRKHWFRVADSVLHEPWSNDVAATFMRLLAYLNTRWAREGRQGVDASSARLTRAALELCTGSGSLARARRILDELAVHVSLTVRKQGTDTVISWPKSAEFQRWLPESGAGHKTDAPPAAPPPQDARRKTQDAPAEEEEESAARAQGALPLDPPKSPDSVPPPEPEKRSPLLNLLAKMQGTEDEKTLWLEHELPVIEVTADGDSKKLRETVVRFYRQYLQGERKFELEAKRERARRKVAELNALEPSLINEELALC